MKSIGPYIVVREVSPAPGAAARPEGAAQAPRTLWATDRLTGIPALLHELPALMSAPELPSHPALLPFSDLVVEGPSAYFVTELPLSATPALDPMLTARSVLAALDELHRHGFAHGAIDSGQVWSVDGQIVLVGSGLHRLGNQYTVAHDLRSLALTLQSLGGLPPILSLLRDAPDTLTARDALDLLGQDWPEVSARPGSTQPTYSEMASRSRGTGLSALAGTGGGSLRAPSMPPLHPMSLLDSSAPLPQSGNYLWQASWTSIDPYQTQFGDLQPAPAATVSSTTQAVTAQTQSETFQLDISQWDIPDFLNDPQPGAVTGGATGAAASVPEAAASLVVPVSPSALQWAAPNRPAASSSQTQLVMAPPAPSGAPVQTDRPAVPVSGPVVAPVPPAAPVARAEGAGTSEAAPSKMNRSRKARAAATRALERLRADASRQQTLAEARRDQVPAQWQAVADGKLPPLTDQPAPETPQERRRREHAALQEQAAFDAQAAAERAARARAAQEAAQVAAAEAAQAAPVTPVTRRQLRPIKATWTPDGQWQVLHDRGEQTGAATPTRPAPARPAWLLPVLGALAALLLLGLVLALSGKGRGQAASGSGCCDVPFTLQGSGTAAATLTVDEAPEGSGLSLGQRLGTLPGTVHFPVAGRYVVRVAASDGSASFTPQRLELQVPPAQQPVSINLGQ